MNATKRGFTLIELLIVVVIIGILASIAIPKFTSVRQKAFISAMKADLRNLANLQDVYYNDFYTYSTDPLALGYFNTEDVTVTFAVGNNTGWSATATHPGAPGESCAIFHGDAAAVTPATTVGVVQCTTP